MKTLNKPSSQNLTRCVVIFLTRTSIGAPKPSTGVTRPALDSPDTLCESANDSRQSPFDHFGRHAGTHFHCRTVRHNLRPGQLLERGLGFRAVKSHTGHAHAHHP